MKQTVRFFLASFLTAALLVGSPVARAQAPAWQSLLPFVASGPVGGGAYATVSATATDAVGNVYVGGLFRETLTLGAITLSSPGAPQGFVAKWSPASQTYLWVQPVNVYSLNALAVAGGSVYVAGTYLADATFGATTLVNTNPQNYSLDAYVAKLTEVSGGRTWAWAQRVTGSESEYVASLAVSGAAVYVAINSQSPTVSFGSLTVTTTPPLPGRTTQDLAVARLTDAGSSAAYAWALGAGGPGDDRASALVASGSTLYVGGTFENTATFPGAATATSAGYQDGFVARLTDVGSTAAYAWVQPLGTADYENVGCLTLNGPALYVGGTFYGATLPVGATTLAGAGGYDGFVARCTPSATALNPAWAQRLGGANNDYPYALLARGGSVYVAGLFNSVFSGYPSQGNGTATFGATTLASAGAGDVFVARLTDAGGSGSYAWAQQAGGDGDDVALTLANSGSTLYAGGSMFGAAATFGAYTLTKLGAASLGAAGFVASQLEPALPTRAATALAGLSLFPNPAHATATVHLPAATSPTTLTLLDVLGRPVRTDTTPAGQDYPLNLAGLAPGVYALRVQIGEEAATRRLVVE